jgi:hypothetical protein
MSDGTFEVYQTSPTSEDWGNVLGSGKWQPYAGKYVNSGERFYGVEFLVETKLVGTVFTYNNVLAIQPDGTLCLFQGELDGQSMRIYFNKGDVFPFSK